MRDKIEVVTGDLGDVWAAKLNGHLVGGWFEIKVLAECLADDLRAALADSADAPIKTDPVFDDGGRLIGQHISAEEYAKGLPADSADAPGEPCKTCGTPAFIDREEKQWWREYCALGPELRLELIRFASTFHRLDAQQTK